MLFLHYHIAIEDLNDTYKFEKIIL